MKRTPFLFAVLATVLAFAMTDSAFAQDSTQTQTHAQYGKQKHKGAAGQKMHQHARFVDANGDGYNDNAPDADGDGIPNGLDPDFTGPKIRAGKGARGFVDLDGDGINDNALDSDGDGIPNGKDPDFVPPQDGSGARRMAGKGRKAGSSHAMGPKSGAGSGTCDGTGPKGKAGYKGNGK